MARVTVEDCVLKVPNRFELILAASQRAREIGSGGEITVDRDNDKNPVVALREIADTDISIEDLIESLIKNHQKVIEIEEDEEEVIDIMEGENEWAAASADAVEADLAGGSLQEEDPTQVAEDAADSESDGLDADAIDADAGEEELA